MEDYEGEEEEMGFIFERLEKKNSLKREIGNVSV